MKALGLELPAAGLTQVSMNLTDYETTPPHLVFERVKEIALAEGVDVAGAELIGLIPRGALLAAGTSDLGLSDVERTICLEDLVEQALGERSL